MKKAMFIVLIAAAAVSGIAADNPEAVRQNAAYTIRDSVDRVASKYYRPWVERPSVMTFVNDDGTVTVCAEDEWAHDTYIYEYSRDMKLLKTHKFPNELEMLGAFTKDSAGNYYFFYAKEIKPVQVGPGEWDFTPEQRNEENMALVKYDASGRRQKIRKFPAYMTGRPVAIPFDAGTCRLEVSGTLIAVYFSTKWFNGHQGSDGFVLYKDTFEDPPWRGDEPSSTSNSTNTFVSHSFNQFILPIKDGFIFVDHSDGNPIRGFTFGTRRYDDRTLDQLRKEYEDNQHWSGWQLTEFPGESGYNPTNAEMGGLVKTSNGYIFAGAFGGGEDLFYARNLFIFTINDAWNASTQPVYLTGYPTYYKPNNTGRGGSANPDTIDAAHPKIVALDGGRYLLLWEKCAKRDRDTLTSTVFFRDAPTNYLATCMLIIDEKGKALSPIQEYQGFRLNMNDVLRYNKQTKKVYWSINEGQQIVTYALDPSAPLTIAPPATTAALQPTVWPTWPVPPPRAPGWTAAADSPFGNDATSSRVDGITWGNGKFVAVGYGGGSGTIATSADGSKWTAVTNSTFGTSAITGAAYGGGKFVAVGYDAKIAYSANGTTWTAAGPSPFSEHEGDSIHGIAWGNGKFVAVGVRGTIATSTDGASWTAAANFPFGNEYGSIITSIAFGGGKFVAVGYGGNIAASADGVSWTAVRTYPFGDSDIYGIAYGGGKFVAVGFGGKIGTSADGVKWTAAVEPLFADANQQFNETRILGVTWGNGKFAAVSNVLKIGTSADGVKWTEAPLNEKGVDFLCIAFGNGKFVAGGRYGRILHSPPEE